MKSSSMCIFESFSVSSIICIQNIYPKGGLLHVLDKIMIGFHLRDRWYQQPAFLKTASYVVVTRFPFASVRAVASTCCVGNPNQDKDNQLPGTNIVF